ncbi:response regulator receiver modulated diguanylate cyclase [Candidatus Magnetobacterium bavaricum]|uniref:diguanylate cyclase n=1 Tax=Candidatus Magnetobacterium bavaricum TaxID=29290 RepID=A0A0F3GT29_9BACT|nr:response regulator receiver modulated diguanylate cyclase [Candidatus Magnetobacterium bavaricum]
MSVELTEDEVEDILKDIVLLCVEDDKDINRLLSAFLRKRVKTVISAFDGQEGLDIFKERNPDIVVTDIRMPNIDGIQMAGHIREIRQDIKIIVTTAFNDEEFFIKAIDANIDSFIKKPIDPHKLVETIARLALVSLQKRELDEKSKLISFILNSLPNFVFTTRKKKLEFANYTFLNFLNCASIKEFNAGYKSLEDILSVTSGDTPSEGMDLISYLDKHKEDEIIVSINTLKDNVSSGAYILKYDHLPESETYLFSLTDVKNYENKRKELEITTITDELTGLYNKRYFNKILSTHMTDSGYPVSLIFFDIDHFKAVNDKYGHLSGDCVLKELAALISRQIRDHDVLARWGGEEFILLTPQINLDIAAKVAQRLRRSIEAQTICNMKITSSFGVATYMEGETEEDFLNRADALLYEAKRSGRNRVCY